MSTETDLSCLKLALENTAYFHFTAAISFKKIWKLLGYSLSLYFCRDSLTFLSSFSTARFQKKGFFFFFFFLFVEIEEAQFLYTLSRLAFTLLSPSKYFFFFDKQSFCKTDASTSYEDIVCLIQKKNAYVKCKAQFTYN